MHSTITILHLVEQRAAAAHALKYACTLLAQHPDVREERRVAYRAAAHTLPGAVRLIETMPPQIPSEFRPTAVGAFAALIPGRIEAGEEQDIMLRELNLL